MRVLTDNELTRPRREHHVSNVVPLRRTVKINPAHPSLQGRQVFDQDAHAADQAVLITKPEAVRIAALLETARHHLPSPRACDEAIALLLGKEVRT